MKKIIYIALLFIILSCKYDEGRGISTEAGKLNYPVNIAYWVYVPPGLPPAANQKQSEAIKNITSLADSFHEKTGINLNIYAQPYVPAGEKNIASRTFLQKIKDAVLNDVPPDLIYTTSEWVEDALHREELLTETAVLIKKHAPYIRQNFPEGFWKYREASGKVFGIPVRKYAPRKHMGFWIIKKQYLSEQGKPSPKSFTDLLELLACCGKEGDDRAVFLLDQGTEPYNFLFLLGGIQFLGNRELFFNYPEAEVILSTRLEERSAMVSKVLSVESMNIPFHYFSSLKNIPWKVLHIPYGAVLYPASEQELHDFKKALRLEDHLIIEDYRLIQHVPLDSMSFHYIPKNASAPGETVKMLDSALQSSLCQDVFLYESDSDDSRKISELKIQSTNRLFYDHTYDPINQYRRIFLGLCSPDKYRISLIYPQKVGSNHSDFLFFLRQSPLSGFDITREYWDILKEQEILHITQEAEDSRIKDYINELSWDQILELATSQESGGKLFDSHIQKIKEVQSVLQERIDLYLRNILEED